MLSTDCNSQARVNHKGSPVGRLAQAIWPFRNPDPLKVTRDTIQTLKAVAYERGDMQLVGQLRKAQEAVTRAALRAGR